MSTNPGLTKLEYTECLICGKTLGAESREEGFLVCHEHRLCSICKEPLLVQEVRLCLNRFHEQEPDAPDYTDLELIHLKCDNSYKSNLSKDPTRTITQSEYDYLNLIRLSVIPDIELSVVTNAKNAAIYSARLLAGMIDSDGKPDHERRELHLEMLQSCLEYVQLTVKRDPGYRKTLLEEREKQRFDTARKEAIENSRPHLKVNNSAKEVQLASMIELHGLETNSRAENLKILSDTNKAINGLVRSGGFTEPKAREVVTALNIKNGIFKK